MQIEKICINCMKEKAQQNEPCNFCGFDQRNYSQSNSHLYPLTVLNGRYLLGRSIGQGGFGIVYIALDLYLNIVVAIKELFPEHLMTRMNEGYTQKLSVSYSAGYDFVEEIKRKFIKEARTVASVEGDTDGGVVQVKDLFEENGTVYMVMEYLDGQTMRSYLKEYGNLDFETVAQMMKPVMVSLKKLHDAGIIHRDISPDNIMILKSGRVKLLDFGDVKYTGSTALDRENAVKSEMIQVKKGYTPLEQYQLEGAIGPWTDVYALCATIYQCITGIRIPEPLELKKNGIKKPSQMGIKIPARAEQALMKGLEIYYEDRIQSVQELYDAFYPSADISPKPVSKARILAACGCFAILIFCAAAFIIHSLNSGETVENESFVKGLDGYYTICNMDGALFWEVDEDYLVGAQLLLSEQKGIKNQCFEFVSAGDEAYYLLNADTGLALTFDFDKQTIVQEALVESAAQQWYVKQGENDAAFYLGVVSEDANSLVFLFNNGSDDSIQSGSLDSSSQEYYLWKITAVNETDLDNMEEEYDRGDVINIPDGLYAFHADSLVMSVDGNYMNDGCGLVLSQDENHNYQKFAVSRNDSGYRTICALHSNLAISVPDDLEAEGVQLVQSNESEAENQDWEFIYYDFGKVVISNTNGMCIGRDEETGEIVLRAYDETDENNIWEISQTDKNEDDEQPGYQTVSIGTEMEITNATYMIQLAQDDGLLLGIRGGYSDNRMDLILTDYEERNSNKYYLILGDNGYYELAASHTNMYLAPDDDGIIRQYSSQTSEDMERYQWLLLSGGEEGVYILQNMNGQCIACASGESGSQAVLTDYDTDNSLQYWKLIYTTRDSAEEDPLTEEQATTSVGDVMEITPATYMIQLQEDENILLGIRGGYSDTEMDAELVEYEEKNSNKFYLLLGENGYYALVASHTNKYLAPDEDGILRQYVNSSEDEDSEERYQWSFLYGAEKGTYIIQNINGKCISCVSGECGEQAVLMDYDSENSRQYWKLLYTVKDSTEEDPLTEAQANTSIGSIYYVEAGTYIIQSDQDASIVLGMEDSLDDGALVFETDYEETDSNRFYLVLNEEGLYSIRASQTNMYIAPDEDGVLRQYAGSETEGFEWILLYASADTYFIQHESGKCIGNADGLLQNGGNVSLQNFNTENSSLYWKLIWTKKDE